MSLKIPRELLDSILSSTPYIPIYEVDLENGETLKLKYITQHTSGALLYSSKKGIIGFKTNWVRMPDMPYNSFVDEYLNLHNGNIYFEFTPEITLEYISYSKSGFATANLDKSILQFKPIYHPELKDKKKELEQKKINEQRESERAFQIIEMERKKRKIEEDRVKQRILELDKQREEQRRKKKLNDWIDYQIKDTLTGCGCLGGGSIVLLIIFLIIFYLLRLIGL